MERIKNQIEQKNNIIGHGIDIVENDRILEILKKYPIRFPKKILNKNEFLLFEKEKNKLRFIIGRFCAKEAIMKALSINYLITGPCFSRIAVLKDNKTRKPIVQIDKDLLQLIEKNYKKTFKESFISISYTRKITISSVILTN